MSRTENRTDSRARAWDKIDSGDYTNPAPKYLARRSMGSHRMRFIHITDPHLSSLDGHTFAALSGKRRSGYLSWTRKRHLIHRREVLDNLIFAVNAESADQIVLTGDLVQVGLEDEIKQVSKWLTALTAPQKLFFVPGNHDVYAQDSWPSMRKYWDDLLPASSPGQQDDSISPYPLTRDLGEIRLIGASSACVTPIFSARGALGSEQLKRISDLLEQTRAQGMLPFLAIHHPPLPGMSKWRKALKDPAALQSVMSEHSPAIACCGHLHHNSERLERDLRVFCTASASSVHNASYRIFDIDAATSNSHWKIRMQLRTLQQDSGNFATTQNETWDFRI